VSDSSLLSSSRRSQHSRRRLELKSPIPLFPSSSDPALAIEQLRPSPPPDLAGEFLIHLGIFSSFKDALNGDSPLPPFRSPLSRRDSFWPAPRILNFFPGEDDGDGDGLRRKPVSDPIPTRWRLFPPFSRASYFASLPSSQATRARCSEFILMYLGFQPTRYRSVDLSRWRLIRPNLPYSPSLTPMEQPSRRSHAARGESPSVLDPPA